MTIARDIKAMGESAATNCVQNNLCPPLVTTECKEEGMSNEQEQQGQTSRPRSPEPRRRKYSFASVKKMLEKKAEEMKESKDEIKERKAHKKEAHQNGKALKKGIFHLRNKQKQIEEQEMQASILLIPPAPCQLGYNDLLIEEVSKPRSSSILLASDDTLLTDVQRPRSPRNMRKQTRSNSEPPSPTDPLLQSPPTPKKFQNHLNVYPNNSNSCEGNAKPCYNGRHSPSISNDLITNTQIRSVAQIELGKVLKGQFFHPKQVPAWSKMISERIMLQVRKLTKSKRKIIATVFIGEIFPGSVDVVISCHENDETDNFQTISTQINNIYAWVSVLGLKM